MEALTSYRPTLAQGLIPLIAGTAVGIYGLSVVLGGLDTSQPAGLPMGGMAALCVGGILFSIGFMITLVVLVRPLFEKRPEDELAERASKR